MIRPRRSVAGALGLAAALALARAAPAQEAADDGPYAAGALAWIVSDRLDLVGTMAAEVPLARAGAWRVFLGAQGVTAISKASNFTFLVEQVSYTAEVGARYRLAPGGAIELFAAEAGRVQVDAVGGARVRLLGAGWETDGFRDAFGPDGWSGRAALGAVVEHRDVDAVARATGAARWMRRVGSARRTSLGVAASVDALLGSDHGVDVLGGPRVDFDLGGDRRFGLYATWLSSGNPLGLGVDGVLAGFDLAQGPRHGALRAVPPEVSGFVAAGGGDAGRATTRLDVRVASPPFAQGTCAEIEVDGNVLTAPDLDDLYYLYDVGIAHTVGPWRPGGWFHHRSNHVLGGDNGEVTSINVLEAGVDTAGWNRAEPGLSLGSAGALDVRLRAGYVVDSAFGHDVAWSARGGVRFASPEWGAVRLYASAECERGDVEASAYAVGLLLPRGWDLRAEQRHDEQLYSRDRRGLMGVATLRF